jgi:hypothetical protein
MKWNRLHSFSRYREARYPIPHEVVLPSAASARIRARIFLQLFVLLGPEIFYHRTESTNTPARGTTVAKTRRTGCGGWYRTFQPYGEKEGPMFGARAVTGIALLTVVSLLIGGSVAGALVRSQGGMDSALGTDQATLECMPGSVVELPDQCPCCVDGPGCEDWRRPFCLEGLVECPYRPCGDVVYVH